MSELIVFIVNSGNGSKVLKSAKRCGIDQGIVCMGMGTMRGHLLELLELNDVEREIVLMLADEETSNTAAQKICEEFKLHKPNHGIGFTVPLTAVFGYGEINFLNDFAAEGTVMYQSMFVVVDKGMAEDVMETAVENGARGGTIVKARASGKNATEKVFNMNIEPEKEIVFILIKNEQMKSVAKAIKKRLETSEGGECLIVCGNVTKTYGMS
ncbi:MAG: P-II family nitrogen regulator [Oscillospiraceae bacterium]|jgi:nitrogen regulatory protein PII|nr:P-II family nitrogen regulator [Oscillospiraceae bacterium]